MEILSFAKDVAQNIAEHVATYRLGQSALRQLDKAMWVVEKCALWAVPPPLDQDERPQQELARPLPWVFFLTLLVALRVTRESISLMNLVFGKPPVRSADVVTYIQSKRRYLRALKYQGNRVIRSRPPQEPWHTGLRSLLEFTMCFRRSNYGNNNTLRASNNDQVLVVKRSKRGREDASPVASTTEDAMERLIEKICVDLDAESDEDSSYTLTNATSLRSDKSEESETDADSLDNQNQTLTPENSQEGPMEGVNVENNVSQTKDEFGSSATIPNASSTPEKQQNNEPNVTENEEPEKDNAIKDKTELSVPNNHNDYANEETKENTNHEDAINYSNSPKNASPKEDTLKFIQGERIPPQKNQLSPKSKIGRKIINALSKTFANSKSEKIEMGTPRREDTPN